MSPDGRRYEIVTASTNYDVLPDGRFVFLYTGATGAATRVNLIGMVDWQALTGTTATRGARGKTNR